MANEQNLIPIRSESEAREKGRNGGKKSGETRRKNKRERDSLKRLLNLIPDMNIFLENSQNQFMFSALGIEIDDIPDVETLTDLKLIHSALNGDTNAKKYIDERTGKNPLYKLKKEELAIRKKEFELKKSLLKNDNPNSETSKLDIIVKTLLNKD